MKKIFSMIVALLLVCAMLWGCAPKNDIPDATEPPDAVNTSAPEPESTDMPGQLTSVPTEEPTPEPTPAQTPEPIRFVFQPKVCSGYMEEVFGTTMCETWSNLVDAVMAGEDTFACPDKHTYDWVMGQFPRLCFPVLTELIDLAWDRSHPVIDGVASFTWRVPKEEAAARIAGFAAQIEGILNEVLKYDYSDFEKALAIYDYFYRTYEYDWDAYNELYEKPVDYLSTYRLFKTGKGICQELAPAYSYLLMQAGVEATTMKGPSHEWSYVRINGHDYHVDPTFVLSAPGSLSYFMMNDEQREVHGFARSDCFITCIYSQDHPHPDYAADDDTFAPLWDHTFESFSHEDHIVSCLDENDFGEWVTFEFDYTGY